MNGCFSSCAIVTILFGLSGVAAADSLDRADYKSVKSYDTGIIEHHGFREHHSGYPIYSGYSDDGNFPDAVVFPPRYEIIPNGIVIDYDLLGEEPVVQFEPAPAPVTYINPLFVRTEVARQILNPLGVVSLDPTLLEATCKQDWRMALQIVDRTIAQTPAQESTYRSQLQNYRQRLQTLANARSTQTSAARCGG